MKMLLPDDLECNLEQTLITNGSDFAQDEKPVVKITKF
jgi:hypothetical protein